MEWTSDSTVEHLVVSHQRDESVRTYSELTTRQCGRRRAKTRGIVRFIVAQPVGALAGVKEKLSQDFVFETSDKRTLVWFGSSFGADISLQNPEPHPYSQPRSYGIVCSKNDRLNIFILYPFPPPITASHFYRLAMVDSPTMRKTFVVPDIKSLDLYDCTKSKICASVGWLLAKSYGSTGRF